MTDQTHLRILAEAARALAADIRAYGDPEYVALPTAETMTEIALALEELRDMSAALGKTNGIARAFLDYFNPQDLSSERDMQWHALFDQLERNRGLLKGCRSKDNGETVPPGTNPGTGVNAGGTKPPKTENRE